MAALEIIRAGANIIPTSVPSSASTSPVVVEENGPPGKRQLPVAAPQRL